MGVHEEHVVQSGRARLRRRREADGVLHVVGERGRVRGDEDGVVAERLPEHLRLAGIGVDAPRRLGSVLDSVVGGVGRFKDGVHLAFGDEVEVVARGGVRGERQPLGAGGDAFGKVTAADFPHRSGVNHRQDEPRLLVGGRPEREHGDGDDGLLAELLEELLQFAGALGDVADEPAEEVQHRDAETPAPRPVDDGDEDVDTEGVDGAGEAE